MIEFDVLPERGGDRLLLAHDYEDAATRTPHTLEEALAYLASARFDGIELDLDLKLPGYELPVLDHVRDAELLDRVADLDPVPLEPRADPRGRAGRAPGLVGPQGQARSVPLADDDAAALAMVRAARPCSRSGARRRSRPGSATR